jgi:predicted DCC family thiol-disulfide oxidoreductase YuxK
MSQPQLTLLYDGSCPICAWEKRNLGRKDKHGKLAFIDIQAPEFDPTQYGTTMDALMARLHGVTADGRVIQGVETIIEAYRAAGWWWAYLPLRALPRPFANKGYDWFASHRHTISRRIGHLFGPTCDQGTCRRK